MKYQKVTGWWVYVIKTPNDMYYPGYSGGKDGNKQIFQRWKIKDYKSTTLWSYIEQFGWENLEKIVLTDGLTEEEARKWEDRLICMYTKLGCCINKNRSGFIRKKDIKEYSKQWYQNHKEDRRLYKLNQRLKPEGRIYQRVTDFNRRHPDQIKETPLEAKQKYLQWGYVPDYIKSDDILKENNDPELN